MPELRWTLLILGGAFILGLALWEIRRQRQAPRQSGGMSAGASSSSDRVSPTMESGAGGGAGATGMAGGGADPTFGGGMRAGGGFADAGRGYREPIITLPELHPADSRGEPRMTARREPAHDPPVVEVDDASFSRLQVEGATGATGATDAESAHAEDTIAMTIDLDADEDADSDVVSAAAREAVRPAAGDFTARESGNLPTRESGNFGSDNFESGNPPANPRASETPNLAAPARAASTTREAASRDTNPAAPSESVGFATDTDDANAPESPAQGARAAHPTDATNDGAPIVDWPREESRRIVALRLVSAPAARFQGRAVRQALAAEGFVLGKFDIFHKAGPDERAVLSAASLTKPGTFTMNTIDAQRFGGISLFAVLPGPLSPQETFDELLTTARSLNSRLQGALQDERGEPLTPMRSAAIRQSLSEGNGTSGHGDGAGSQSETRQ
jgi:FtsZ-interacting cell division protein ZipA